MKNFEKYHDELLEHGRNFALVKNEADNCLDQYIDCDDCHFHGTFDCEITKWKWLFEECVENKYQLALEEMMELYEDVCPFDEHREFDKDYEVIQELIERFEDEIK